MSQNYATRRPSGLTRRAFIGGALATGAALALAGCGEKQDASTAKDEGLSATPESETETPAANPNMGPVDGGTFNFYINNPVSIDPYNVQEDQGMEVCKCLFDALTEYDYENNQLIGKAATSWEANDDATQFTFHLREGATFANGDPVTASSFIYAWNRLCSPATDPANPSEVSYHLSMVDGYDEVVADNTGEAKLNLDAPDDYTFVVNLNMSYADFPYVVSHLATSPVPESAAADISSFKLAPVGNGAFMMEGEWVDGQYIQVVRNENYVGNKPHVDGVNFNIYKDVTTAFTEFEAGNLDYAQIPTGRIQAVSDQYGVSPDGYTANPGEQTLLGDETSIYYLTCNNTDELMGNVHMRKAFSHAINRQAICDTVFEGTRVPAANIVTPGIAGYEEGVWEACAYDVDKAKEELEEAKKELNLGDGDISIQLSCNSDGDHEAIMQLIQADLKAIGVEATIDTAEWAAYLTKLQDLDYQVGRLGWIADYPIMDNFLYPLFYTGNGDNRFGYSNPDVDKAMNDARAIVDADKRIAALQEVNKTIAADFPVVPLLFYRHTVVTSNRVNEMYSNPMKLIDLTTCWLSA